MLGHCNFCRWNCRVDRSKGAKVGTCKLGGETRVSTYFHHQGEELIHLFALAMRHNIPASSLKEDLFAFPTFSSDVKNLF